VIRNYNVKHIKKNIRCPTSIVDERRGRGWRVTAVMIMQGWEWLRKNLGF